MNRIVAGILLALLLALGLGSAHAQLASPPMLPFGSAGNGTGGSGGITIGAAITGTCPNGQVIFSSGGLLACEAVTGTGTVTSVGWTGGIVSIANPTTVPAFTIAGTSGGIPYFSSASTWASSGLLAANALMIGGGAATAPSTTMTGTNVLTALGLGVNTNGGVLTGSTASVAAGALHLGAGSATAPTGLADVAVGSVLTSGGVGSNPAYSAAPQLGASGTLGSVTFGNATSGLLTLEASTGALGTITEFLPIAGGDTLAAIAATQTLTNKSIAGSEINSGTVPIAQIPTGTSSTTVPLGGVITAGGPTGSATVTPVITYNAAGQLTAVTTATIAPPYTALPALSANQVLGALTATTPSGQSVPSCSGASNALTWTSGTGFGCNTISGGGAVSSVANSDGTLTVSPTTGSVVASIALGHANTWTGVQTLASPVVTGAFTATGLVTNADLANPATTVNGTTCTLGSTCTVTTAQVATNAQTGTIYAPLSSDVGKLLTFTNAAAIAVTLTDSNFTSGNYFNAIVLPTSGGSATFTPSSGTINGFASVTLAPGSPGATFVYDGTNWKIGGSGVSLTNSALDVTPGYQVGSSYLPYPRRVAGTGVVGALQNVYCTYAYYGETFTASKLGIFIPTTVGTTNVNLGIYSSVNGRPGTLLQSTGAFANTSTGFDNGPLIANFQFQQGAPYWKCQMTGDTTMVMNGYQVTNGGAADIGAISGSESVLFANNASIEGVSCGTGCNGGTPTSLVFPTNLAGSTWVNTVSARAPAISATVASVP